jgi:hypothetical protein
MQEAEVSHAIMRAAFEGSNRRNVFEAAKTHVRAIPRDDEAVVRAGATTAVRELTKLLKREAPQMSVPEELRSPQKNTFYWATAARLLEEEAMERRDASMATYFRGINREATTTIVEFAGKASLPQILANAATRDSIRMATEWLIWTENPTPQHQRLRNMAESATWDVLVLPGRQLTVYSSRDVQNQVDKNIQEMVVALRELPNVREPGMFVGAEVDVFREALVIGMMQDAAVTISETRPTEDFQRHMDRMLDAAVYQLGESMIEREVESGSRFQ